MICLIFCSMTSEVSHPEASALVLQLVSFNRPLRVNAKFLKAFPSPTDSDFMTRWFAPKHPAVTARPRTTAAAEAARKKGQGEADAKFASFQAEANGLREVNKALAEANQNPLLIELKKIEVEKVRADRWNGAYPQWMMNGATPGLMLNVAPPAMK